MVSEKNLQYALYALIGIGVIATLYLVFANNFQIGTPQATPTPSAAPVEKAKLVLTIINVPDCRYCVDLTDLVNKIKGASDVQVIAEKTVSYKDAQDLIFKYQIKKLPTIILSGETNKVSALLTMWQQIGVQKPDGTLILTQLKPMYYDVDKGDFVGKLKMTRLTNSSCDLCTKPYSIQALLETNTGLKFVEEQEREFNSTQGKALVKQYNITKIPALIITGDIAAYDSLGLRKAWKSIGTEESDGALVWRLIQPPYQELPSKKIKGLAKMIGIAVQDCKQCYDLEVHARILGQMGIQFSNITYYNYTQPQAQALIAKYNITNIPMVLIDGELKEYYPFTSLEKIWQQAGTVEKDGWYVFRNASTLGTNVTYKNILTGKIETTT